MLHRIHLIACLIAACLLAAGPMLPAMAGGSPERFVEICSGFGIKQIAVDQDGTPLPPANQHPESKKHCPFCVVRSLAAITLYTPPDLTAVLANAQPHAFDTLLIPQARRQGYNPRDPPVLI